MNDDVIYDHYSNEIEGLLNIWKAIIYSAGFMLHVWWGVWGDKTTQALGGIIRSSQEI